MWTQNYCFKNIKKCDNNTEVSPALKVSKHAYYCYSLFTHCSFNSCKNKPFLRRCWLLEKTFSRFKKVHNRNNQLWEQRNAATDRRGYWIVYNKKICYICKKKFHGLDDSNDDSDDDKDDEKLDASNFHCDTVGFDDVDDYHDHYDNSNDDSNNENLMSGSFMVIP